ncbi:Sir2 family NAD-dependent protein deacetylase [Lipingzhangella sp. LS1_29]|uniref:protein acetyllysine N-acetyltransferase n=1 Tax=Lipingzhangella rawalii TaxID=2055835 RepID=A0ABU2H7L4_9ACTN|nr:Sir2 family NAD-dependent protein deacetylase [Lipingzhangella rawalii]MDS1271303.1 Sir2 family NAD-dependent protein deacetylase [Lipingzhangella rawalii]
MDAEVTRVAQWVAEANEITVLTGAGLSTESGIPDFRGPQGLWTTDPNVASLFEIDRYVADPEARRQVWQLRRENPAWSAEPNAAHRALREVELRGQLRAIVTQNIDGLHQRAGSEHVVEVHGTMHRVVCLSCERRRPAVEVLARLDTEPDPACVDCGGIQKSDTISFGQRLRPEVMDEAVAAAQQCELFLAVGTSLSVQPVAGLCEVALESGARLVIVNGQETPYDAVAAAVVRGPIGTIVPQLVSAEATPPD